MCCAFLTAGRRCSSIGCHGAIVFGGNQNFNLVLAHGGTLYIDGGRPTAEGIATTLANLRDVSPTLHFQTFPPVLKRFCRISPTTERLQQISFVTCG